MSSLNRVAWLALWEKAVAAAAERVTGAVNARLEAAAAESRYPRRRLRSSLLTPADTRAIAARLGGGGAPFVAALDDLEQAGHGVTADSEGEAVPAAWRSALATAARRLEAAWIALEQAADREQRRWQIEVERVHRWRLPLWPLWLLTAMVLVAALYVGLVLGGYVRVPQPLAGFAELWWSTL